MIIKVATQAGLDNALKNAADRSIIEIHSPKWKTLKVEDNNGHTISVHGDATVEVFNDASVFAYDKSAIYARGTSEVTAYDSATVNAIDAAQVYLYDFTTGYASDRATITGTDDAGVNAEGEASVIVNGRASVTANGRSSILASEQALVNAYGRTHVEAHNNVIVRADQDTTVYAYDTVTIKAYGEANIKATSNVVVRLYSPEVKVAGGQKIEPRRGKRNFFKEHNIPVKKGWATVYKAVDDNLEAGQYYGRRTVYPIGGTVTAPDWSRKAVCGMGLHFSATPRDAQSYSVVPEPRFLECRVRARKAVSLGDKIKAESCVVIREVDIMGRPL